MTDTAIDFHLHPAWRQNRAAAIERALVLERSVAPIVSEYERLFEIGSSSGVLLKTVDMRGLDLMLRSHKRIVVGFIGSRSVDSARLLPALESLEITKTTPVILHDLDHDPSVLDGDGYGEEHAPPDPAGVYPCQVPVTILFGASPDDDCLRGCEIERFYGPEMPDGFAVPDWRRRAGL